jgi:hypothetical protein
LAPDTVYVYGVVPVSEKLSISTKGVEDGDVGVVEHAGLAALTSRFGGDSLTAARDVRAHWRVLEEAFQQTPVLPLRFGTVLESEEAVRIQLLEPNLDYLNELLAAIRGRVQLNLKGSYNEEQLLREIVRESAQVRALRERLEGSPDDARSYGERVRLGELVAAEFARRRDADTRRVLAALEPLAVATRQEELRNEHAVFSLAFLVERKGQEKFDQAVGELRQELGRRMELRYVGPLVPFSFAEADLTSGSPAWA